MITIYRIPGRRPQVRGVIREQKTGVNQPGTCLSLVATEHAASGPIICPFFRRPGEWNCHPSGNAG